MKRSEKEAEVRRLLETPEPHLSGLSIGQTLTQQVFEMLVGKLVEREIPPEGWEYEFPSRLELYDGTSGHVFITALAERGARWFVASLSMKGEWHLNIDEKRRIAQAAIDAYNAMKEAEEAESDPNDPLTVALERVAAEEVAKLIEDAVNVAREETLKECVAKCASRYTREEFVAAEFERGVEGQGLPGVDFEELDPDVEEALRKRAEWNAQAAERAGIVWRRPSNEVQDQFTARRQTKCG